MKASTRQLIHTIDALTVLDDFSPVGKTQEEINTYLFSKLSSGGNLKMPDDTPNQNVTVGATSTGYVLAGKLITTIEKDTRVQYNESTLSFSIASDSQGKLDNELGTNVTSVKLNWSITQNQDTFVSARILRNNIELTTGLSATGTYTNTGLLLQGSSVALQRTYQLQATFLRNGVTVTKTTTLVLNFIAPFYYGYISASNAFVLLTTTLQSGGNRSNLVFTIPSATRYVVRRLAFFGNITAVTDVDLGYNYIGGFLAPVTRVVTFANGETANYLDTIYDSVLAASTKTLSII